MATARYISSAGSGTYAQSTNIATPMSWATMLSNLTAADIGYVIADGTYSRTTSSDGFTGNGASTAPLRLVGMKTAVGDGYLGRTNGNGPLDVTNFPVITYTTGNLGYSGKTFVIVENLNITSAVTTTGAIAIGAGCFVYRCKISNTANNSSATGVNAIGGNAGLIDCDISESGSSASSAVTVSARTLLIHACRLTCPNGPAILTSAEIAVVNCQIYSSAYGVDMTANNATDSDFVNTTFYGITNDIFRFPNSSVTKTPRVVNCNLTDSGRIFNNQFSATAVLPIVFFNNRTRDITNADIGLWDLGYYNSVTTDTGNYTTDYVDAPSGDFRLVSTSPAKGVGIPAYASIGALQPQGGGGSLVNAGLVS